MNESVFLQAHPDDPPQNLPQRIWCHVRYNQQLIEEKIDIFVICVKIECERGINRPVHTVKRFQYFVSLLLENSQANITCGLESVAIVFPK